MTASTMPYCKSAGKAVRRQLMRWLLLLLVGVSGSALAGKIEPVSAELTATDEGFQLAAEFQIELGAHLEEAVSRGVPLYFVLEFDLTRNRWYWANEHIAGTTINYRLSYAALTRQYRLSRGGLYQNFATLQEALRMMSRVVALPVVDKSAVKAGEVYQAALRLTLDRQQLPKPFQVDAIANRDWQVEADIWRWQFIPRMPVTEHTTK